MKLMIRKFYRFLDQPLAPWSRTLLVLAVIPLALTFAAPLWNISMTAPQYPKGLEMDIYVDAIEGGHGGLDISEINELNHYIGMRPITRESFVDLTWMPFALGLIALLTLRVAAIGNVRSLIDVAVLTAYVAGFAFYRFVTTLSAYGHELDPRAAIKIEPFSPVVFGTKQIANFETSSYPRFGSVWMALFVLLLFGVLAWHLVSGRRAAVREQPSAAPAPVTVASDTADVE